MTIAAILVAAALAGLFVGWLLGPVSNELRAYRERGCYFGNQTTWTPAKRWVAFWYGRKR